MSNLGLDFGADPGDDHPVPEERPRAGHRSSGGRRAERRGGGRSRSCLTMLVVLAVVLAGAWFGGNWAVDRVKSLVGESPDYPGPGSGSVIVEVKQGATAAMIGQELKAAGVVESVGAFTDAAVADERSLSIQVGFYELKKKMKASDALAILVDPSNLVQARVTIPEGFTVDQIVARLAKATDIPARQFRAALAKPGSYGLPDYARGNPEGYLFPATYSFPPKATPAQMFKAMVARYERALGDNNIEAVAAKLGDGYTPEQVMTVASLVEAEGRGADMPKIARAIYNRLELPAGGGTNGLLQIDASVLYALGTSDPSKLVAPLADLTDSEYNTYRYPGLPPGPIGSPGEDAILAALRPTPGPWVYWVTVDCAGKTEFSTTLEEHNQHDAVDPSEC